MSFNGYPDRYSGYSDRRVRARIKELERKVADHEAEAKSWESRLAEKSRMIGHAEARARKAERALKEKQAPAFAHAQDLRRRMQNISSMRDLFVTEEKPECVVEWCKADAEEGGDYCARCRKNIESWRPKPDELDPEDGQAEG